MHGICSVRSTLHSKHSLILQKIIFIMNTDSIKGQVRCIQTLTVQVKAPSLETSKLSLYFSGCFIPINPKLSYIFTPEFLVAFNRFQCKKYLNTLFIFCNNCRACVELTLEIQRESIRFLRTGMLGERDCNKVENKTFLLVFSTSLKFHTTIN